jgi:cyclophilin family peptidyl-prolyl cis-trans isomerase
MRLDLLAWATALLLLPLSADAQIGACVPDESDSIFVELDTSLGPIVIELFPNTAPLTVQNFLDYMDAGAYEGVIFHRSVPGFVVQGGGYREGPSGYASILRNPPVPNEPCISNTRGSVAMARLGGQPDSATSEFFVNLVDNLFLDTSDGVGFTAFGRVTDASLSVVDAIAALPTYDALLKLELPINQIFSDLPLQSLPADPPGGFGCSRDGPHFGLVDPTISFVEADPLRSGAAFVPILLDPICTGASATGPPSTPCTPGTGRVVVDLSNLVDLFGMTCDAVAESEESWAARRAATESQLYAEDVEVARVPEPAGDALLGAGGLLVFGLARSRRGRVSAG